MLLSHVGFIFIFGIQLAVCHKREENDQKEKKMIKEEENDQKVLVFAHVVHRHGDRNILTTYETDPYKNESFWPEGFGQLTNAGKRTEYELGKYLHKRYRPLIGPHYSADRVYVRSTNTDRALMSAECAMAALFPPSGRQIWKYTIPWQPVPIHTIPLDDDYLLYQVTKCPRAEKLVEQYMTSYEIQYLLKAHSGLLQYLERNSKTQVRTVLDVALFYESLVKEKEVGLPLSEWAEFAVNSDGVLEYFASTALRAMTHSTETKKIRSGFLLKDMLDRFTGIILSSSKQLLYIYSAHDNVIINLLNSLNVYELHVPPYGSSVHVELYQLGQKYYVQVFYRRQKSDYVPPIDIPNCGIMCPLDKFYDLYRDILPTETETFDALCNV